MAGLPHDERVLILLQTARDGERACHALVAAQLDCHLCGSLGELCAQITAGAGIALLAEETLTADRSGEITAALARQPAWSDFPLVVISRDERTARPAALRESMNLFFVDRPVRLHSLCSVIRAALRSRRHQYEVRGHMAERERQARALRDNEERLQFALTAGRLGSWEVDLVTEEMVCSALHKENLGRPAHLPLTYAESFEAVHPDDRTRVRATLARSIEQHADYDIEYRTVWPDQRVHWVLVRGRATYAPDGTPLSLRGVSLDMTDRRYAEEALRDADRKKDDFLALLAHELRNPLAPIRNALQLLRLAPTQAQKERAQHIMERQLGHMVRFIEDLLDISRINRNKLELRIARITLAEVVGSAVETVRPAVDAAGHALTIDVPEAPIYLDADLTRLSQVLANLLMNSAKYTPRGGRIALLARQVGNQAVVKIEDSGIGIPKESLSKIFDMFSQVDRSVEKSTGGLGIGLALVKGLVEMHGGTVTATSEGPGLGSLFTVRLPAMSARAEAPSERPELAHSTSTGPRRRFLVVDDNHDAVELMADMLRLLGHEVAVAHDGLDAVDQAESVRPQIILMDIGMPRLNGLDATRRIRQQPGGSAIRIIALTGWGQDGDRLRSREAGCDGHLVKPVKLGDLVQLLNTPPPLGSLSQQKSDGPL